MSRTYEELVTLVRRWANRDIEVLPDTIVADCIRYAADKSYRHLRIAPLEHTVTYSADALNAATANSNNSSLVLLNYKFLLILSSSFRSVRLTIQVELLVSSMRKRISGHLMIYMRRSIMTLLSGHARVIAFYSPQVSETRDKTLVLQA